MVNEITMQATHDLKILKELSVMERNQENLHRVLSDLKSILKYNFQLQNIDKKWFSESEKSIKNKLGQVDTPGWVADLISKLSIKSDNVRVLDPCFGNGIFLKSAFKRINDISKHRGSDAINKIFGVEIDPILFSRGLYQFLMDVSPNEIPPNFFLGDIFDFKKANFDVIILNPPYVRQEILSGTESFLSKTIINKKLSIEIEHQLSARSNLYAYFLVHLTTLLSKNGQMGAIVPKVWLDSRYGKTLQDFLLHNYEIQFIIDFDRDTFPDVIVEDCILVMKKSKNSESPTKFVHVKKKTDNDSLIEKISTDRLAFQDDYVNVVTIPKKILSEDSKWGKFLHTPSEIVSVLVNKKMIPLTTLAGVSRGLTTNWNEFFMLDTTMTNGLEIEKEFVRPIIKSPRDLTTFDTGEGASPSNMLWIEKKIPVTYKVKKYLENATSSVNKSTHSTIARLIKKQPNTWYLIRKPKSGPIIFSYIIRRMKNFIFNSEKYLIRDNFYIIEPKEGDPLLLFGVLNSSIVKLNLELIGRRYGNGLLKIQTYELLDMPVPDIRRMTKEQKNNIIEAAKELLDCKIGNNRTAHVIEKIDKTIDDYLKLDIDHDRIIQLESEMMEHRLKRVE